MLNCRQKSRHLSRGEGMQHITIYYSGQGSQKGSETYLRSHLFKKTAIGIIIQKL